MGESSTERALYPILKMIIETNKKLEEFGYKIKISYFCGDAPISQSVCGLIEGVGNAHYFCRICYIKKSEFFEYFDHCECHLRKSSDHEIRISSKETMGVVKIPNFLVVGTF